MSAKRTNTCTPIVNPTRSAGLGVKGLSQEIRRENLKALKNLKMKMNYVTELLHIKEGNQAEVIENLGQSQKLKKRIVLGPNKNLICFLKETL
jgi:hypothetical protein